MNNLSPLATIFISCITSASVLSFIQFLIKRHDEKGGVLGELIKASERTQQDIKLLREHVDDTHQNLKAYIAEQQILECRVRILKASDEIRRELKHSEEFYDQINDDISNYNKYCLSHPEFQNNKATHAIANINRAYAQCIKDNSFL